MPVVFTYYQTVAYTHVAHLAYSTAVLQAREDEKWLPSSLTL